MNKVNPASTSITSWCCAIGLALKDYGIDHKKVFEDVGLDWSMAAAQPYDRFPVELVQKIWQYAYDHTDECFGVTVASHLTPASFHALGYALCSSETLLQLLERLTRYRSVISQRFFAEILIEEEKVFLSCTDQRDIKTNVTHDTLFYYIVEMIRHISSSTIAPTCIHLSRKPRSESSQLSEKFGAPITFNADYNAIEFKRRDTEVRLANGCGELAAKQDALVEQYISEHGLVSEYMMRVKAVIDSQLKLGAVTISDVANSLNVTVRTLQRRLANEQASFHDLLDGKRCALALECVKDPSMNATQTAYRLGFNDSGSFGRSFKQWTGHSFTGFRARLKNTTQ